MQMRTGPSGENNHIKSAETWLSQFRKVLFYSLEYRYSSRGLSTFVFTNFDRPSSSGVSGLEQFTLGFIGSEGALAMRIEMGLHLADFIG